MPVTKSAIKAMKQNRKANVRNKAVKADFRAKIKNVKKSVEAEDKNLGLAMSKAIQSIDKAAKNGVIHKNTASRRKSRLMNSLNKALGSVVELATVKTKAKEPAKPKKTTTTKKTK